MIKIVICYPGFEHMLKKIWQRKHLRLLILSSGIGAAILMIIDM